MSFRFNFHNEAPPSDKGCDEDKCNQTNWHSCEKVLPDKQLNKIDKIIHAKMFTCDNVAIGHILIQDAIKFMEEDSVSVGAFLNNDHSDLVSGLYEGGLKIWECTYDLISYLENQEEIKFQNTKVLDLGCGAGILGIYSLMNGSSVTFQDYNKEVLEYMTIPNVLLNLDEDIRETEIRKCEFYSGDWASFGEITDEIYDVILTSETIYNEKNYDKLISLLSKLISKSGIILVAAKTYYFGVGGGTRQFEDAVQKCGKFKSEVVFQNTDGVKREILKLTVKL